MRATPITTRSVRVFAGLPLRRVYVVTREAAYGWAAPVSGSRYLASHVLCLRSPLHDRHVALGAKFAEFGGWEMPLEYKATGVLKEHAAVRDGVGIFDVSHLGKLVVRGDGAVAALNACLSNDLDRITAGQAQYTLACDAATGGVVDDLIAYRHADDHVLLVPNAANTDEVRRRLAAGSAEGGRRSPTSTGPTPCSPCRARARDEVLAAVGLPVGHDYMAFAVAPYDGQRGGRLPHRLHRRARLRAGRRERAAPRLWDAAAERRRAVRDPARAASAPATPCAPRWATRCTARTSAWRSRRSRRGSGWAVGWKQAGVLGPRGARGREGGRSAGALCVVWWPRGGASPGRG